VFYLKAASLKCLERAAFSVTNPPEEIRTKSTTPAGKNPSALADLKEFREI
jgi:hypothetical protein